MIFSFLKNRISKHETDILKTAERIVGFSLIDTYRKLSKQKRLVFLEHAKQCIKARKEYLEFKEKFEKMHGNCF